MPRTSQRRFTLVEMLVVIAIIGILASLLMPSLMKAQGNAQVLRCGNNQRMQLVGLASYTNSNNDNFPTHFGKPVDDSAAIKYTSTWWMWTLKKSYDVGPETFRCPNNPHNESSDGNSGWVIGMGYDDSFKQTDTRRTIYTINARLLRTQPSYKPAGSGTGGRVTRVRTPTRTILTLEYAVPGFVDGVKDLLSVTEAAGSSGTAIRDHYSLGSNFGLVDGHVEKHPYPNCSTDLYFEGDPSLIIAGNWYHGTLWYTN